MTERPQFYALHYQRDLFRSGATNTIGFVGSLLCCVVAVIEDQTRKSPVTITNTQLFKAVGTSRWETLKNGRDRAVKAGWLAYKVSKGTRKAGEYHTIHNIRKAEIVGENTIRKTDIVDPDNIRKADTDNIRKADTFHPNIIHPATAAVVSQCEIDFEDITEVAQVVGSYWNENAKRFQFSAFRKWTPDRLEALRDRVAETDWRQGWRAAIDQIVNRIESGDSFRAGGGDKGWKANIDWFLRETTLLKLLEEADNDANNANGKTSKGGKRGRVYENDYSQFDENVA